MQHRRRQHIFQAAKRAAFNHPIKTNPTGREKNTASQAYFQAALCGMGWCLIPDGQGDAALAAGILQDMAPGCWVDVPLYWHGWQMQSPRLQRLSRRLQALAAARLHV